MKEKNMKLKIFFIAILFIIMPLILFKNSYALELNEDYAKEDFIISEDGKILKGFSESGKEKLKRNDYKLVLDGNVLGPILEIGEKAFVGVEDFSNINFSLIKGSDEKDNELKEKVRRANEMVKDYIKEIQFKNLPSLKKIQTMAFKGNNLQNIDFSGAPNIEKLGIECFAYNINLKEVDISNLNNLKKKLLYTSSFIHCGYGEVEKWDRKYYGKSINLIVAYKNPLNLNDFTIYTIEHDFESEEEYDKWEIEHPEGDHGDGAKNIYIDVWIMEPVSYKLEIISGKFQEAQTCEIDQVEDNLNDAFGYNDELKEKWLEEKGYKKKESEINEKYNKIKEEIDAEIKRIENIEPLKETNEQLLNELNVVENKVLEYKKNCCELKNLKEKATLERLKERLEEIKKLESENSYKYAEIEYKIKEMQNKCCSIEAINEIKQEIEKIKLEKESLEKEIEKIKLQLDLITKENNKNKDENKELNDKIKELNTKITEINETVKEKDGKIKELEGQVKDIKTENTEKDKKIEELEKKIAKLEEGNKKREDKIKESDESIKKLTEENEKLKEDKEKNKETIEQNNKKIEELEKENKETKKELENIKEELKKAKEACKKDFNEELTKKDEEIERLKEKIKKQEKENEKLREKLNKIEEKETSKEEKIDKKVTTNTKSTNKKDTKSNNKLPYAGSESVIVLSLITIGAIIYTKRVMKRK